MINREKLIGALITVLIYIGYVIVFLIIGVMSLIIIALLDEFLWRLLYGVIHVPTGKSGYILSASLFTMSLLEIIVISLVGAILVVRHGWWSKKLIVHVAVWYLIYMVVSMGIIIYEGIDWGLLWNDYLVIYITENSLMPLIVIAITAGFTAFVRSIKKQ